VDRSCRINAVGSDGIHFMQCKVACDSTVGLCYFIFV